MTKQIEGIKKEGGLEKYLDGAYSKGTKRTHVFLTLFFVLGSIAMWIAAAFTPEDQESTFLFLVVVALGCTIFAIVLIVQAIKAKTKPAPNWRESLTNRHGNYTQILPKIEEELLAEDTLVTVDGTFITENWLVVLDLVRPVEFIHKTEVACILGVKNTGTFMVWGDGEVVVMEFGPTVWESVFMEIANGNPYILSNDDLVDMPNGKTLPAVKAYQKKDGRKLIAEMFRRNKAAEKLPLWSME